MARVRITAGSWAGQVGEFVRQDEGADVLVSERAEEGAPYESPHYTREYEKAAGHIVARMAGGRLVEFDPAIVEHVGDEADDAE